MAYERKRLGRTKVRYDDANDDNLLTYQLLVGDAKITPTSATITIYAPGGTTALVSAASMTVTGSLLTYAVNTTTETSWPVGTGYRAEIVTTYSSVTYPDVVMFDVCKFVPPGRIGRDQLVALDQRVRAMSHDGDEDFSELIGACRDEFQFMVETKVLAGNQLLESMILDAGHAAVPLRHLILSKLFKEAGNDDAAKDYRESFDELFKSMMAGIKFDKNQDLAEDTLIGGVQQVRLVT
jgi:hypothetical protein